MSLTNGSSNGDVTWTMNQHLKEADSEVYAIVRNEKERQKKNLEMVASENYTSLSVLDCMGSCLHNKYSEGQPGQRYYGGNEYVDQLERLAQARALALYNLDPEQWGVNVQPYSGSPANMAVLTGVVEPHGRIMGLDLPDGGHLTHGFYTAKTKVSASSIFFESFPYKVDPATGLIDYDALEASATLFKPKLIIAGISCYARYLDYARFKKVADMNGSYLMADMAHVAGLVATGLHPSPFEHCDIVTSTVHKTLRGPRAGIIFFRKGVRSVDRNGVEVKYDLENRINMAVFPGLQGGPHNHAVGGIAVAMKTATTEEFKQYQAQVVSNARRLAASLIKLGYKVVTGGTDIHLVLVDMKKSEVSMSGAKAEFILESVSISCNKNTVPGDKSALNPSGIRLGTPSLTTRGLDNDDMDKVVEFLHKAFTLAVEVEKVTGPKLVDWKKRVKEDPDTVKKSSVSMSGAKAEFNIFLAEFNIFLAEFNIFNIFQPRQNARGRGRGRGAAPASNANQEYRRFKNRCNKLLSGGSQFITVETIRRHDDPKSLEYEQHFLLAKRYGLALVLYSGPEGRNSTPTITDALNAAGIPVRSWLRTPLQQARTWSAEIETHLRMPTTVVVANCTPQAFTDPQWAFAAEMNLARDLDKEIYLCASPAHTFEDVLAAKNNPNGRGAALYMQGELLTLQQLPERLRARMILEA